MLLTDEQLEKAARKYCQLMSLDPEETVQEENTSQRGFTLDVCYTTTRLEEVKRKLKEADVIRQSIAFGFDSGSAYSC